MRKPMIQLTRLNGIGFWISADQIEFLESTPDTVITLLSGKKVIVKEGPAEIVKRVIEFKRQIMISPEILVEKQGKENLTRSD